MSWQEFEKTAEIFINKFIKINCVKVEAKNGADSNSKDLIIKKKNK